MRVAPEELHSGCIGPKSRRLGHSRVHPSGSRWIARVSAVTRQILTGTLNRYLFRPQNLCRLISAAFLVQEIYLCSQFSPATAISLSFPGYWLCKPGHWLHIPAALRICPSWGKHPVAFMVLIDEVNFQKMLQKMIFGNNLIKCSGQKIWPQKITWVPWK